MKPIPRRILLTVGIICLTVGIIVLGVFAYRRISREYEKANLLKTCPVLEIESLHIKAPILEGTDEETLSKAVGHFPDTGNIGSGNYCVAGHNSTIYAQIFNDLDRITLGDIITITDIDEAQTVYTYSVTETFTVSPNETYILTDYGDDRLTCVTCTDDGTDRFVAVATLIEN